MSEPDDIIHYTAVRMRVVGSGFLQMRAISQDNVYEQTLAAYQMQALNNIRPTSLMNFQHQRMHLEGKTTEINERFHINKIVIFGKTVFTDYPSGTL